MLAAEVAAVTVDEVQWLIMGVVGFQAVTFAALIFIGWRLARNQVQIAGVLKELVEALRARLRDA